MTGAETAGADTTGDLAGLRVLVTGGGDGIGYTTSERMAARGALVAVIDLDPSGVTAPLVSIAADVTDDASVSIAVQEAARRLGGLDVVVNNAGVGAQGTLEDDDLDRWWQILDVNLLGTVRVTRTALPYLRRSSRAAIVNVASIVATAGLPRRALYSASKGAVLALSRAAAADLVSEGIRVNCVCPGTVDTSWVGRLFDAAESPQTERAALTARQPMGRLVRPEEVADAIAYLASPAAASVTGTALEVDGGMSGLRVRPGM